MKEQTPSIKIQKLYNLSEGNTEGDKPVCWKDSRCSTFPVETLCNMSKQKQLITRISSIAIASVITEQYNSYMNFNLIILLSEKDLFSILKMHRIQE